MMRHGRRILARCRFSPDPLRPYPVRVTGARVAFDGTDPIRLRAASALIADHRIERIGIVGRNPPQTWGERAVAIDSAEGWDVTVATATTESGTDVTVGPEGTVSWAGPTGLVRALGVRLGGEVALAGTVPGEPARSGPRFGFPEPLGWLHGVLIDGVHHTPVTGAVAGVMAVRPDGTSLAIVDEREFLDGAALAAGVLLAVQGHRGPVWEAGDSYLEFAADMGLVVAERSD
jgi:hypothetical protein